MKNSFYGWYLKCQSDTKTAAFIPAVHTTQEGKKCSIQVITDQNTWMVSFPANAYRRYKKTMKIGENQFGEKGICLDISTPKLTITGKVVFGPLSPLKYDIMGPFCFVPFLECRHSVMSMRHRVNGSFVMNGEIYQFENSCGYWEGDHGWSFPNKYLWTQCCFPGGSLMLSVAQIPMAGFHFTGIICVVYWKGKEYRLATYLGARVDFLKRGVVRIVQGDMELEARLLKEEDGSLKAPKRGAMVRVIQESVACLAFYRFRRQGNLIFEFETDRASFEYEY